MLPTNERRAMMAEGDEYLERLEIMMLAGAEQSAVPPDLGTALAGFAGRIRGGGGAQQPTTVRRAHGFVLGLQRDLMFPTGGVHRRQKGARAGVRWLQLELPPRRGGMDGSWIDVALAMVDRAYERWAYTQHHLRQAASLGDRRETAIAWERQSLAMANYLRLVDEVARVRS